MRRAWITGVLMAAMVSTAGTGVVRASGGGGEREGDERGEHSGRGESGEGEEVIAGFPVNDPAAAEQLAVYRQECGDCHVAYPPKLLDAGQWQRLLAKLEDHFGDSATLTEPSLKAVTAYLTVNAARPGSIVVDASEDLPRISRSRWFLDEHSEVSAAAWKRESVGSAANCYACHRQAADGRYDEDGVRIPR
jgi:mono/diheme cytochrome c family protein